MIESSCQLQFLKSIFYFSIFVQASASVQALPAHNHTVFEFDLINFFYYLIFNFLFLIFSSLPLSCPRGDSPPAALRLVSEPADLLAAQFGSACDQAPTATTDGFFTSHQARGASFPLQQPAP